MVHACMFGTAGWHASMQNGSSPTTSNNDHACDVDPHSSTWHVILLQLSGTNLHEVRLDDTDIVRITSPPQRTLDAPNLNKQKGIRLAAHPCASPCVHQLKLPDSRFGLHLVESKLDNTKTEEWHACKS